jgi:hypothetical protein
VDLSLLEIRLPIAAVLNTPLFSQHGEFQNHPANKKWECACNIKDLTRKLNTTNNYLQVAYVCASMMQLYWTTKRQFNLFSWHVLSRNAPQCAVLIFLTSTSSIFFTSALYTSIARSDALSKAQVFTGITLITHSSKYLLNLISVCSWIIKNMLNRFLHQHQTIKMSNHMLYCSYVPSRHTYKRHFHFTRFCFAFGSHYL